MTDTLLLRLEPRFASPTLDPGLSARTADPAWFLAMQWMLGEFDGDDAGTPVLAAAEGVRDSMAGLGTAQGKAALDPARMVLDAQALGREDRLPADWTLAERLAAGQALARLLAEAGLGDTVTKLSDPFGFAADGLDQLRASDPRAAALAGLLSRKALDGGAIAAAFSGSARDLGLVESRTLNQCLQDWRAWLDAVGLLTAGRLPGAWQADRLEHAFTLTTTGGMTLLAPDLRGERLDWSAFDIRTEPTSPMAATYRAVPSALRFRGMPSPRYWDCEDRAVDLGGIEPPSGDLVRLALAELALVYGNDILVLPLREAVGTLLRLDRLLVTDSFGRLTSLAPAAALAAQRGGGAWSFCAPTAAHGGPGAWVMLPPDALQPLDGPVLEDIALRRDEVQNLVWAVEVAVEGPMGQAERRQDREAVAPSAVAPASGGLAFRLMDGGQPFWFPMPLRATSPGSPRRLELQRLAGRTDVPLGRLLPAPGGTLAEEEVPPEGLRVQRRWRLARAADGTTVVWESRARQATSAEALPHLAFDVLRR
jgi:hypothetical protein